MKNKLNTGKTITLKETFSKQLNKYSYSDDIKNGIAYYGKYNDLPYKYLSLLDDSNPASVTSTWHNISMMEIGKYVQGNGLTISEGELPETANSFNQTYNEVFEMLAWDFKIYGGCAIEVIWDRETLIGGEPRIAEIYQIPFKDIRAKEKNYRGLIESWYVSNRWNSSKNKATTPDHESVEEIPVFNPLLASYDEANGLPPQPKQILVIKRHNPASEYYPEPDYKGALVDIHIDSQVRKFKMCKLQNDIATNMIVQFVGDIDDKDYAALADDFSDQYQGAANAGTPILMNAKSGSETHQIITPQNAKGNAETYDSYQEDARQRILSSHGITFGEIVGIDDNESLFNDAKMEKYVTFLNTTIRDLQMPLLQGLNKLTTYLFGTPATFSIERIDIVEGFNPSDPTNGTPTEPETTTTTTITNG